MITTNRDSLQGFIAKGFEMSKHIATPWKVFEYSVAGIHIESELKVGWGIAEIQTRADADFIVRACNSFDSLVQELGDAIQLLEVLGEDTTEFKKALAEAKE